MKKYILYFVLLECCLLINGCSNDTNKTHSIKKSHKEPTNDQKIEKPDLGDTLFLGFRVNMGLDQIENKLRQLYKNKTLGKMMRKGYTYRFFIDDQNYRLRLNFLSKGNSFLYTEKQDNFLLDEILLEEIESYDLRGPDGLPSKKGERFRESLLKLYTSKYKFQKIVRTNENQTISRPLNSEERKIEDKKSWDKRAHYKEIKLPDAKSILFFNREKGVLIICDYGFSEQNIRTIQFQRIEIRYLIEKRIDHHIGIFNGYKKTELEEEEKRKKEEEKIKAKKEEVFENI